MQRYKNPYNRENFNRKIPIAGIFRGYAAGGILFTAHARHKKAHKCEKSDYPAIHIVYPSTLIVYCDLQYNKHTFVKIRRNNIFRTEECYSFMVHSRAMVPSRSEVLRRASYPRSQCIGEYRACRPDTRSGYRYSLENCFQQRL